ncbi:MAG: IS607 family transposase [Okeania sp. SIO2C2]|uniref:IS607 family transposase n=1 Tax=Okeania sp. SIO2C2 TaxID=2607787 RepID=UPI0013BD6B90|nr:IS607 family transposase [Okeania sp. SIO2C2]NEP85652.1 IS607 family transposase [Okeania sp. SIO2C2]
MTKKLLTTSEVCIILNVTRWTLAKWEKANKLKPIRTTGGHRRFHESEVNELMGVKTPSEAQNHKVVAVYCRVSCHDQKSKGDLDRQKARTLEYCVKQNYKVEHILSEVGSGMNDNRHKLNRLFDLVRSRLINKVVLEHKDRLTRFNFNYLDNFFSSYGVEIEMIESVFPKSYEAELVEDIVSLMASFSAKLYGKRSSQRRQNHIKSRTKGQVQ